MPRLRLLGLLLACSLITPVIFGRVGENEKDLTARYGAVTSRQPARKFEQGQMYIYGELLSFRFEFWTVTAVLIGNRCEEINYVLKSKWTNPHFRRLLEINGGWTEWTEQVTRNPDVHREWRRGDQVMASWGLTGFMVRTPAAEKVLANLGQPSR